MIGGGGGALFVVALVALFSLPERVAAATSLVVVIPTTVFGSIGHWRNGHIDVAKGLPLLIAGPFGAIAGTIAIRYVNNAVATKLLSAFLVLLGVQMAFAMFRKRRSTAKVRHERATGTAYGLLGGLTSGAFGISGSPPIVTGLVSLGLDPVRVIGTSIFALTSIAVAGALTHAAAGDVDWKLAAELAVGSAVGAYMGAHLLAKLNSPGLHKVLRPTLIGLVAVAGLFMWFR